MKKVCVVLCLALILPGLLAAQAPLRRFTLSRASLERNDSVGNEWSWQVWLERGDETIPLGLNRTVELRLAPEEELLFTARAVEDEKYPDVGRASQRLSPEVFPAQIVLPVIVQEDRGRYKGHTALWEFTLLIE